MPDSLCYDVMIVHENSSTRWASVKGRKSISCFTKNICYALRCIHSAHYTKIFSHKATTVPRRSLCFLGLPYGCCPIWRLISSQLSLTAVWFDSLRAHGLCKKCSVTTRCCYRCSSFVKGKLRLRVVAVLRSNL